MNVVGSLKSPLFPTALKGNRAQAVGRVMERGCGDP